MLEWNVPLLVRSENGRTRWVTTRLVGCGNVYEVTLAHKAKHPEVIGYDCSQAWSRWL